MSILTTVSALTWTLVTVGPRFGPTHGVPGTQAARSSTAISRVPLLGWTMQDVPITRDTTRRDSLPASFASISTDTGALAPGWHDFTRYDTQEMCQVAIAYAQVRPTYPPDVQAVLDTMHDGPQRDTIGLGTAVAVARRCGPRWLAADTSVRHRYDLLDVVLTMQDDTLAQSLVTRRIALATTAEERDSLTLDAMALYLQAWPARERAAAALMAHLDAAAGRHIVARVRAHDLLRQLWILGRDWPKRLHEDSLLIALGDSLTPAEVERLRVKGHPRRYFDDQKIDRDPGFNFAIENDNVPVLHAYRDLVFQTELAGDTAALPALCARAHQGIIRKFSIFPPDQRGKAPAQLCMRILTGLDSLPSPHSLLPAPIPTGGFWFPAHPGDTRDSAAIMPGTITLYISINGLHGGGGGLVHNATKLRQMVTQYGPAGVRVVVFAAMRGWTDEDAATSPAQQAERVRWYVQDQWHVPAGVLVQVSPDRFLPAPDGRRDAVQTQLDTLWRGAPFYENGSWMPVGVTYLVGRDGHIVWRYNDKISRGNHTILLYNFGIENWMGRFGTTNFSNVDFPYLTETVIPTMVSTPGWNPPNLLDDAPNFEGEDLARGFLF